MSTVLLSLLLAIAQYLSVGALPAPHSTTVTYAGNGCAPAQVSSGTAISCTITGVTAGQSIWVSADGYVGSLITMTLTYTGTYASRQTVVSPYMWVAGQDQTGAYVLVNVSSGSHTITMTFGSSVEYLNMTAVVLNGGSPTSPIDNAAGSSETTSGSGVLTCPNVTTSSSNEFLLAFGSVNGGATVLSAGTTPQTMTIAQYYADQIYSEYGTAATAGTNYATFTSGSDSATAFCNIVAVH